MAPASSKIKHPQYYVGRSFSKSRAVTKIEALESILNALGRIADLVEACRESSPVTIDRDQRKHFCRVIVDGANGFTRQFNTAAAAAKSDKRSVEIYTDEASK